MSNWHKIGVTLTLLWCVGGGLWINNWVMQEMKSALISEHESCRTANESVSGADRAPCGEKFAADWNRNIQDQWKERAAIAMVYTLIPVPIVWLVVYGLVAIVRKRGKFEG